MFDGIREQCNVPGGLNSLHSRFRWVSRVAALAFAVLLQSRATRASSEFEAPNHCGTREQFEANIRARVGEAEAGAILAILTLRISEQPAGYALAMQVGSETRYLQDRDCTELFRAAVVVAIALWQAPTSSEPLTDSRPSATRAEPSTLGSVGTLGSQERSFTPPTISGPHGHVWVNQIGRPRRYHLQLASELGLVAGLQPTPGPFLGVRVALDAKRFGLAASVRWAPTRGDRDANGRGVDVSAIGVHAVGYYKPAPSVGLEFGASADYLEGTGLGSSQNRSAELWTIGPALGFWAVALRSGRAFVLLGAEGHLALLRPSFEIAGYGRVFRVPRLTGTTFLAIGYRF